MTSMKAVVSCAGNMYPFLNRFPHCLRRRYRVYLRHATCLVRRSCSRIWVLIREESRLFENHESQWTDRIANLWIDLLGARRLGNPSDTAGWDGFGNVWTTPEYVPCNLNVLTVGGAFFWF
jgi:hypothetical protein